MAPAEIKRAFLRSLLPDGSPLPELKDSINKRLLVIVIAEATSVVTGIAFGMKDVVSSMENAGDSIGVKASGGIRTYADAIAMIEAGANRIGASASRAILAEAQ